MVKLTRGVSISVNRVFSASFQMNTAADDRKTKLHVQVFSAQCIIPQKACRKSADPFAVDEEERVSLNISSHKADVTEASIGAGLPSGLR